VDAQVRAPRAGQNAFEIKGARATGSTLTQRMHHAAPRQRDAAPHYTPPPGPLSCGRLPRGDRRYTKGVCHTKLLTREV
jgi:hypothetical protein